MASDRENWNARYGYHAVKAGIHSPGIFPDEAAARIADAIAAERERCAKIAEAVADAQGVDGDGWPDCQHIAMKIRGGEPDTVVVLVNPTTRRPTCFGYPELSVLND